MDTVAIAGRTVSLPVVVRDAAIVTATFVVPAAGVQQLLPDRRLAVVSLLGRTLCLLTAVEYRDNDLGRYNEFGVAFLVRAPGATRAGAYIHRLPVTTDFSCAAGRDIWGFPKFLADIRFVDDGGWRTCSLDAGGAHVLTLAVRRGGRRRLPERALDAYAVRDGVLFRTPFVSSAEGLGWRLGGARLVLGAHPMAAELRRLGLPRRPLASTSIVRMQARFEAPVRL